MRKLTLSLCVSLCVFLSVSLCVSLCVCLSLCVCVSLSTKAFFAKVSLGWSVPLNIGSNLSYPSSLIWVYFTTPKPFLVRPETHTHTQAPTKTRDEGLVAPTRYLNTFTNTRMITMITGLIVIYTTFNNFSAKCLRIVSHYWKSLTCIFCHIDLTIFLLRLGFLEGLFTS